MKTEELKHKLTIALALRSTFCNTKEELLRGSYLPDESIVELVREMQDQYMIFRTLCDEIKSINQQAYDEKILCIKRDKHDN